MKDNRNSRPYHKNKSVTVVEGNNLCLYDVDTKHTNTLWAERRSWEK